MTDRLDPAEAVRHDLYVRLHPRAENTTIHRTAELLTTDAGGVMVDYAASGEPLGLEVLGAVDVEVDGRRPVLTALDAARAEVAEARAEVERLAARLSAAELENAALRSAFTDAMGVDDHRRCDGTRPVYGSLNPAAGVRTCRCTCHSGPAKKDVQ